ncbi:MAG: MFS transporter [Candidatus Hydrogenedentes bacterium]|nr:MFS transporter [Candidatus Hydrogenedentota bacterium]
MNIPIVSGLRELDRAPRRFLLFIVFNVISWQCIVGPSLVLFGRKIGMDPSWVGFLISFMPLSQLLVVVTARAVTRLGSKRVMFTAWMLRNLVSCTIFLMPWAMFHWGQKAGAYVLMFATLGFCLMRAVGSGGWFPWLHEVVPHTQRGIYFSSETAVTQLLSVILMAAQAFVLRGDPSINRFLLIYGAGVCSGFFSLLWMSQVPGGEGTGNDAPPETYSAHGKALADRAYMKFIVVAGLCFAAQTWFGSAIVMYMRDALHISSQNIMLYISAGSLGILCTVGFWGRYAEHSGSGAAMSLTLVGYSLTALACLTLQPGSAFASYGLAPVIVLTSVFAAAFAVGVNRALLHYVKEQGRVGYTNIWSVGAALSTGVTPILAGLAIDHLGLWGYRLCFALSGVAGLVCAVACRFVVHEERTVRRRVAFSALRPDLPLRTLANIVRITVGGHESNSRNHT